MKQSRKSAARFSVRNRVKTNGQRCFATNFNTAVETWERPVLCVTPRDGKPFVVLNNCCIGSPPKAEACSAVEARWQGLRSTFQLAVAGRRQ
ncbi:hypothetical protein C1D09_010235 [Mesorhizobium intechi]|nr:hypothetical protein C1D09_010235 [Mesorhizobium intechi]